MAINVRKLLEGVIKIGASDLHLKVGQKPIIRLHGVLRQIEAPQLSPEDTEEANTVMMPERLRKVFNENGACDYSYGLSTLERFRINAYHQRGAVSIAIRKISAKISTIEDLHLPPVVAKLTEFHQGLILVTGVTGSGKSSTLSALINFINRTQNEHIITIEDPIEFLYQDEKCVIQQVEVGSDVIDFKHALRNALRQDPDVILLGELRDKETVETAMHCVETGHLVFSTLHTADAKQTIMRILHFFPQEEHSLVNEQCALNLKGVICQRLLRTADNQGRVPCCEILFGTPIVQKLIREGEYDKLEQVLMNGEDGMQRFDMHLLQLVKDGLVDEEEAMGVVHDEAAFKRSLQGRTSGSDRRGLIR